jgi:hypothetical protein
VEHHMRAKHPDKTIYMCDYVACMHLFFTSEEEKNAHMNELHAGDSDRPKVVRCVYCDRVYKNNEVLGMHVRHSHRNIVVMKCNYSQCETYLKCEEDREKHIKEKHQLEENVMKCIYCDIVMHANSGNLVTHMKAQHRNIIIRCTYAVCGTYFKCEADRQQHLEEKHKQRENDVKCIYCDQWVRYVGEHMRTHHQHVAIRCTYSNSCSTYFKSESDRDEHIEKVHRAVKVKQKVDCIYCGKSYPKRNSIRKHIALMHGDIAIRCRIRKCAQYFVTQEDCDKHFMEIHDENEKLKTIVCSQCSFKTGSKNSLTHHIKEYHNKKEIFKCKRCPDSEKIFKSSESLKYHMVLEHIPNNVQKCTHCNKSIHKYSLSTHLTSEYCSLCKINYLCKGKMIEHKKWCKRKCEICLKEFSGIQVLKHIIKEHKDVDIQELEWLGDMRKLKKNMKCAECKSMFYNLRALNLHAKKVHGVKKPKKPLLSCDLCKKQFRLRFYLEQHMISVHKSGFDSKAE